MDFRMDKSSWILIFLMIIGVMYLMIGGGAAGIPFEAYLKSFGFALLVTIALIAVMSLPVLIVCYFIKKIPDIDYSIRAAAVFLVLSVLIEVLF